MDLIITSRGEARLRAGHLWVYAADVGDAPADAGVVRVLNQRGKCLGRGLFSPRSQIALRLLTPEDQEIDKSFLRRRLEWALAYRRQVVQASTAYRLVYGEGDLLPSLVVDRYG
ncbi:MAG: rRNA large subunit methyltransferase I, partial [Deinococcus sp.]|nr:rRNA large subunit methyltransferase I [Deinococcus sp.]